MRPSRLEKKSVNMKKKKKEAERKMGREQGGAGRQGGTGRQGGMGRHEKKVNYLKIVTKNSLHEILYDLHGKLFSIVLFYVFAQTPCQWSVDNRRFFSLAFARGMRSALGVLGVLGELGTRRGPLIP